MGLGQAVGRRCGGISSFYFNLPPEKFNARCRRKTASHFSPSRFTLKVMILFAAKLAVFLVAYAGMEAFAWVTHRYVMHGALWCWHRSHHEPRHGLFELNDLFAVVFATPAIVCIWLGVNGASWCLPLGLGITAYGATYFLFHDGLVHRRFPVPLDGRTGFWRSRLQAHRIHHAVTTKNGCVSFGFLWVRPARDLKAELSQMRRLVSAAQPAPGRQ